VVAQQVLTVYQVTRKRKAACDLVGEEAV